MCSFILTTFLKYVNTQHQIANTMLYLKVICVLSSSRTNDLNIYQIYINYIFDI